MAIDFPYLLEVHFLTVEQAARYLDTTVDIVVSLIEQGELFAFAAIPSTPMVFVPDGYEKPMRQVISNPQYFPDFDLEKATVTKSGIFRIQQIAIKSVAINGNSFVDTVWNLSQLDHGYGDEITFGGECFFLRNPVEIKLFDIRLPTHLLKRYNELKELDNKSKELGRITAEKKIADESNTIQEKPLHETERRTLLNIIKALAQLKGIKPIKERENGDGWWNAANELLQELARKKIEPPCNEKTLAKHLRNSFESLR